MFPSYRQYPVPSFLDNESLAGLVFVGVYYVCLLGNAICMDLDFCECFDAHCDFRKTLLGYMG